MVHDSTRRAFFEWSTGHQPDATLREMFEEFGAPSAEWQTVLKRESAHPRILDMTHNEASQAPDDELEWGW